MRATRALSVLGSVVLAVTAAALVAPGLSSPSVTVDAAGKGGQCRQGPVAVNWVIDPADPAWTTGVRVSGLAEDCSHNKIELEVLDDNGEALANIRERLQNHSAEVTIDFDQPVQAAPVAEVRVVLSGAKRG